MGRKKKTDYKPSYAEGQVLVGFKSELGKDFARTYIEAFGYSIIGEFDEHPDIFIVKVKKGQEKEVCTELRCNERFIDFVDQRDIKYEQRKMALENLIKLTRDLIDDMSLMSDYNYNERLNVLTFSIQ